MYSYVILRDFGFAPNPFYGICTLATCKPDIRASAQPGDWVIGTESKDKKVLRRRFGTEMKRDALVFAMKVSEALTFQSYWNDPRFSEKRPYLRGSKKQAFGDNIYHHVNSDGSWIQEDSHHSYVAGEINKNNVNNDTKVNRVLIGEKFVYWGREAKRLPAQIGGYSANIFIKNGAGHRCDMTAEMIVAFEVWLESLGEWGYLGDPADWNQTA